MVWLVKGTAVRSVESIQFSPDSFAEAQQEESEARAEGVVSGEAVRSIKHSWLCILSL